MRTDLEPIVEKATPRASLGYSGIEKFSKLREQSLTRVASTTQIGLYLLETAFASSTTLKCVKWDGK